MNWELLAKIVPLGFAAASFYSLLKGRADWLLALLPMSLALGGFNFYAAGTVWFPIKVVMIFGLLYCVLNQEWIQLLAVRGFNVWWLLLLSILTGVIVGQYVEAPFSPPGGGGLQGSLLRPLVQAFSYSCCLAIIPLALCACKQVADVERFFNAYAIAGVLSVFGCVAQLGAFAAGVDFMPILRLHGNHNSVAAFAAGGIKVFRLYAFAGEPKSLAAFLFPLAVASAVRLAGQSQKSERVWWSSLVCTLAFFGMTVLTFSSAVLVAMGAVALIGLPLIGPLVRRIGPVVQAALLIAVVLPAVGGLLVGNSEISIWELVKDRTVERIEHTYEERPESQALHYLFEERPDLLVFGVGLGMFNYHLPGMFWSQGVNLINSGWVTFLMDLGLLGTGLWGVAFGGLLLRSVRTLKNLPFQTQVLALPAVGGLLASLMMHGGWVVTPIITLWGGILLTSPMACNRIVQQ